MFTRTEMLIGKENLNKIKQKKIIVFGLGGVGSYIVEALVRSGIEDITLVDNDIVSKTNINRQLYALNSTIGLYKTEVAKKRIEDINPKCKISLFNIFYNKETYNNINLKEYDFVIDAIDTISSKIYLAKYCYENNINIISSMGTGNRLDPTQFYITDIYKTSYDPVCKVMRHELKKLNIKKLTVLASKENPRKPLFDSLDSNKRQTPASISFTPASAGLIIVSFVINKIIEMD